MRGGWVRVRGSRRGESRAEVDSGPKVPCGGGFLCARSARGEMAHQMGGEKGKSSTKLWIQERKTHH